MINNEFKKYIVEVCNYIDILFSIVLIGSVIKGIFVTFTDNDWVLLCVGLAGAVFWPNKKYIEKWLHMEKK